jgi:Nickel responsive protein SCO4226-like
MRKFIIEREIPAVGRLDSCGLADAARKSNTALATLAPRIQWQHSYVTADKTFCVYLAQSEEAIREHARLSGFPANRITEVTGIIDPSTAIG